MTIFTASGFSPYEAKRRPSGANPWCALLVGKDVYRRVKWRFLGPTTLAGIEHSFPHEVVLGTLRIDAKANEIVAVPALIEQLDITGCLVTTDALSCQVKTAERILAKAADYLLALKHNHPASFGVEQGRTQDARYYISSATGNAAFFNQAVRSHWRIENAAHWVLAVDLREDESRLRKDNGPENMAVMRRFLLSLLKQDKSCKLGIKNKRLKMTWDQSYFLPVLSLLMS